MKIKSLQLKNFKRFTDLTLQDIPDNTKLVLLIGSNGSGKSSVFDAFERILTFGVDFGIENYNSNNEYYSKIQNSDYLISLLSSDGDVIKNNSSIRELGQTERFKNSFYGRTSLRQIPRLTKTSLGNINFNIENNSDRPKTFIDRDSRFENDLEHIFGKLLKEFFRTTEDKSEIKKNVIDPINEALNRIFNKENGTKLELLELIPPLEGKTAEINFKKGESEFHYNYLSAGEKEVFNILINLVARGEYYKDTIFFFDEIDLHLNTKLQYNFLKEIVENWIPNNCQLWTASHSLGFIEYANDYDNGCIIDFDDLDFDKPQTLIPKPKDQFEIFEIAVSKTFIDKVVQGRKIIFSENTDTPFYNDLAISNTLFFVAIDENDVFHKARNLKQYGLIDRDYLSDEEIKNIKTEYPFLYIIPYYSIENLICHPDNLEEYYKNINKPFDKESYIKQIIKIKNDERDYLAAGIIQARSGYPFYKENENAKRLKEFKENYKGVIELLRSDNFEEFYKVFPAKDYGKAIAERRQASTKELVKTNWFKTQIENTIK
jgi:AAA15 family ATPase/GTPase